MPKRDTLRAFFRDETSGKTLSNYVAAFPHAVNHEFRRLADWWIGNPDITMVLEIEAAPPVILAYRKRGEPNVTFTEAYDTCFRTKPYRSPRTDKTC